jgi:uncharacterized phage protein (TIGR02218 family)
MSGLETQATTLCNIWIIRRSDGRTLGFTNHDADISYNGVMCQAASGLTGAALQTSTGLSVDNTEALGALQSTVICPEDIIHGRYDGAEVDVILYDWSADRVVSEQFRATIGEVQVNDGTFVAELRGKSDLLNQPLGRVYQPACDAVLGDARCGVDLSQPEYRTLATAENITDQRFMRVSGLDDYPPYWFERGTVEVMQDGVPTAAIVIKSDKISAAGRTLELWFTPNVSLTSGTVLRVTTGCNRRADSCAAKFGNILNFRGFPTIPGEDWAMSYPSSRVAMDGGKL